MSSNLFIALILLPVIGGLIAWAGDVIGYRLGKSRRTLFGLRPRSTARLVGIVVGGALPLAGLGFAMIVSQDARDAILRIKQLRQSAAELGQQNAQLTQDIVRARARADEAQRQARDAGQVLASTRAALARSQVALGDTQRRLQAARQALSGARTSLSAARRSLSNARADLGRARDELSRSRADLARSREELARSKTDLARSREELARAKTDLQKVQADYARTQEDLARTQSDLAERQKLLDSATAQLQYTDKIEREAQAIQEYLAGLQAQLAATEQALARYKYAFRAIIEQDVAYEPGQEIIRAIFDSHWSQAQLEAQLEVLLDLASASALAHGIPPGPTGRAVRVVSPVPPEVSPSRVSEQDIVSEVASQIKRGDAPTYVVIVRSWGRAIKGQAEEMTAEFWVAPNKIVFRRGEVMHSRVVDGSRPRANVFRDLWQIIQEVRRVAADRGMLPDPATGLYGEVTAEDFLDALDRVLAIGGPATVRLVVANDVRVAQSEGASLLVRIEIEPAKANGENPSP